MLDLVIDQLDRIKFQAQNINLEIETQAKMLKRITDKAEKARQGLEKKNSGMLNLLDKYRSTNKCWKDILLIALVLILLGLNIKCMQMRGWLPRLA